MVSGLKVLFCWLQGLGYVEPIALASARRHFGTLSEAVVVPQEVLEQDYEMYTNRGKLAKYGVDLNDGRKPLTAQQVRCQLL